MEFWGVEVEANDSLKVTVKEDRLLHISQVALGERKPEDVRKVKNVPVRVETNGKEFVVGILSPERAPQLKLDLVFEKDLELSHGWKCGSVYVCGYITDNPAYLGSDDDSDEEEEALNIKANGGKKGGQANSKPNFNKGKKGGNHS